jgi:alpha-tubulin suppressor-like RCC1 family protein
MEHVGRVQRLHGCTQSGAIVLARDSPKAVVGTTVDKFFPTVVSGLNNVRSISAGHRHTCAVLEDGTASCWGYNSNGQLGDGNPSNNKYVHNPDLPSAARRLQKELKVWILSTERWSTSEVGCRCQDLGNSLTQP